MVTKLYKNKNGVRVELVGEELATFLSKQPTSETLLSQGKLAKISKLKENRDEANIKPMTSHEAEELIEDIPGNFIKTGNKVYFSFNTAPTGNPATEPSSICIAVIIKGMSNSSYYLRYSCQIIEGETIRKGYVAMDLSLGSSLMSHAELRNTNNVSHCNTVEKEIDDCSSLPDLELIDITFP